MSGVFSPFTRLNLDAKSFLNILNFLHEYPRTVEPLLLRIVKRDEMVLCAYESVVLYVSPQRPSKLRFFLLFSLRFAFAYSVVAVTTTTAAAAASIATTEILHRFTAYADTLTNYELWLSHCSISAAWLYAATAFVVVTTTAENWKKNTMMNPSLVYFDAAIIEAYLGACVHCSLHCNWCSTVDATFNSIHQIWM